MKKLKADLIFAGFVCAVATLVVLSCQAIS